MKAIKLLLGMTAVAGALTMTSCGDDDETPSTPDVENTLALCQDGLDNDGDGNSDCDDSDCTVFSACDPVTVETVTLGGSIGTMTLDASKIYVIDRFAYVADGDVLTIPAGTILKANDGQGADASALIIARGGKIMANGTADNPIIFTSVNDGIMPGETASTLDATAQTQGQWGGLIVLGNAPVSVKPSKSADGIGKEGYIEGVPSTYSYSIYGGDNAADNSGELSYVSIRFTGSTLATDEEIQGLTLGGVGSGTKIENIEVFSSFDDGIEIFGGTVNVDNLLVAYQTDDAIDLDQSYDGTIDNAVVLLYNPETGNDGMEIDGPEATDVNDGGLFTVTNTTIYQKGSARIARLKSKAQGTVSNFAAKGFSAGQPFYLDGANTIELNNSEFNLSEADATAIGSDGGTLNQDGNVFDVTNFTKGADESVFGWTYAKSLDLF